MNRTYTIKSRHKDSMKYGLHLDGKVLINTPFKRFNSTLHTPPSTHHTPHSTLHPPHSTLHTSPSTLHPPHSTLHTPSSTLHTPHCFVYIFFLWRILMKWVFATNSNVLIPISLQPDVVDLWYFILWILLDKKSKFEI